MLTLVKCQSSLPVSQCCQLFLCQLLGATHDSENGKGKVSMLSVIRLCVTNFCCNMLSCYLLNAFLHCFNVDKPPTELFTIEKQAGF